MEILTKLTKRNLILNKKRTIGTIIGIVLSVALICALSGMFKSFQETLVQNAINERCNFHIALETINSEELSKYKLNKDIKFISALYIANRLGINAYGVNSDPRVYSGQVFRELREILARNKDFVNTLIKPEPTYLGEVIPISGNGDITNDK